MGKIVGKKLKNVSIKRLVRNLQYVFDDSDICLYVSLDDFGTLAKIVGAEPITLNGESAFFLIWRPTEV
jgi:hypothetical protein